MNPRLILSCLLAMVSISIVVAQNGGKGDGDDHSRKKLPKRILVCLNKRNTRFVGRKQLKRLKREGKNLVLGSCDETFATICVRGRRTIYVRHEHLEKKLLNNDATLGQCICPTDTHECPDGSLVSRNWEKACRFDDCAQESDVPPGMGGMSCPHDEKHTCPNGMLVGRNPFDNCNFFPCPCNQDTFQCPNGDIVGRDGFNECEFEKCPAIKACTKDAKICPGGLALGRDKNCMFPACPCCSESSFVVCSEGNAQCCPDGTWACPSSDGKYACGENLLEETDDFGEVCRDKKCCPLETKPGVNGNPFCFEGAACCPDGVWSCSIGDGKTFPCGVKGDVFPVEAMGRECGENDGFRHFLRR